MKGVDKHAPTLHAAVLVTLALLLAGCAPAQPPAPSEGHISSARTDAGERDTTTDDIPAPVTEAPAVPPPSPTEEPERYTVVVNDVPVDELLFALARDADLEIDIGDDIEGRITLNAIEQTLPRLLERIALQAPIRYELRDDYLHIAADEPYLETYPVPYVNLTRTTSSAVETATQIGSTGFGDEGATGGGGRTGASEGSNNSSTSLLNESDNRFWETLEHNLAGILNVEVTGGDGEPAAPRYIMLNREAGYITVRATQRQQAEVQRYLDRVVASARRQVLIEATVVEVTLSDQYQAGIDWSYVSNQVGGLDLLEQNLLGGALGQAPNVLAQAADPDFQNGTIDATVRALETFGDVQVMSSPKIMALNNQLAILKVVDNRVFFTVDVETTLTEGGIQNTTFETEVNTVPIGLVMTVTPYVGSGSEVLLNVRPTVSRILDFRRDPNPELADAGVENEIPEIQVREMESLLRVNSGQVAVIGGLMQDSVDRTQRSVPGLGRLPLVGRLFSFRDDQVEKTELIIFLQPTVVNEASLDGDLRDFRRYLPDSPERRSRDAERRAP